MNRRHLLLAALALAGAARMPAPAAASLETRRIGRKRASLREARDVFEIGTALDTLDVCVRDGSLWIDRIEFAFADGASRTATVKRRIPKGGVAAVTAFTAGGSALRQVVVCHANLPLGRESPVIELWGRPVRFAS